MTNEPDESAATSPFAGRKGSLVEKIDSVQLEIISRMVSGRPHVGDRGLLDVLTNARTAMLIPDDMQMEPYRTALTTVTKWAQEPARDVG